MLSPILSSQASQPRTGSHIFQRTGKCLTVQLWGLRVVCGPMSSWSLVTGLVLIRLSAAQQVGRTSESSIPIQCVAESRSVLGRMVFIHNVNHIIELFAQPIHGLNATW